jgi:hypothetical protein
LKAWASSDSVTSVIFVDALALMSFQRCLQVEYVFEKTVKQLNEGRIQVIECKLATHAYASLPTDVPEYDNWLCSNYCIHGWGLFSTEERH